MPKQLQKALQDYLSKIKKPTSQVHSSSKTLTSSTNWILRGCKHPKTPSFSVDRNNQKEAQHIDEAATLSDIDRFLFENFKSLYQNEYDEYMKKKNKEEKSNSALLDSPSLIDPPANISDTQQHVFVARASSSSLVDQASTSTAMSEESSSSSTTNTSHENSTKAVNDSKEASKPDDFITVLTYSPSPCQDFRRSMHEMIEARLHHHETVDWDFMEELFFCYLDLNDKKSYKYILSAFVDMIILLRENSGRIPMRTQNVQSEEEGESRKNREDKT